MRACWRFRMLGLDQIWWMVTPGNPLKSNGGLPALAKRMEAAARVAAHPRIFVSGAQFGLPNALHRRSDRDPEGARAGAPRFRRDHGKRRAGGFPPLGELAGHCRLGADRGRRPAAYTARAAFVAGGAGAFPCRADGKTPDPRRPRAARLDFRQGRDPGLLDCDSRRVLKQYIAPYRIWWRLCCDSVGTRGPHTVRHHPLVEGATFGAPSSASLLAANASGEV